MGGWMEGWVESRWGGGEGRRPIRTVPDLVCALQVCLERQEAVNSVCECVCWAPLCGDWPSCSTLTHTPPAQKLWRMSSAAVVLGLHNRSMHQSLAHRHQQLQVCCLWCLGDRLFGSVVLFLGTTMALMSIHGVVVEMRCMLACVLTCGCDCVQRDMRETSLQLHGRIDVVHHDIEEVRDCGEHTLTLKCMNFCVGVLSWGMPC